MNPETHTTELTEALAKPAPLTFKGKTYDVEPLDLNNLADLEALIGDVSLLDPESFAHQRVILWLAFRRIDPTLTADQKRNQQYKMTLADAGRLLTLKDLGNPETSEFMRQVLVRSGVLSEETEAAAPGNDPAPKPKTKK